MVNRKGKKKKEELTDTTKGNKKVVKRIRNKKLGKQLDKKMEKIVNNEIKIPTSYISQEEIARALKYLENNKSSRNITYEKCVHSIDNELRDRRADKNPLCFLSNLLEEARKCLIKKDWDGLARILVIAKPTSVMDYTIYFPIFLNYAAICLFYNPKKELLNVFLQSVLICSSEEEKMNMMKTFMCLRK